MVDDSIRRLCNLRCRNVAHVDGIGVPVIIRQVVGHDLADIPEHCRCSFPATRQAQCVIAFDLVNFLVSGRVVAKILDQLTFDFGHRLHRLVGLHRCIGNKRTLTFRIQQQGKRAIGPGLILSQVHIDA